MGGKKSTGKEGDKIEKAPIGDKAALSQDQGKIMQKEESYDYAKCGEEQISGMVDPGRFHMSALIINSHGQTSEGLAQRLHESVGVKLVPDRLPLLTLDRDGTEGSDIETII
ncbi:MAG: hypothetical protein BWY75_03724 [bacterium ADurb.Bin425]|nr:MAG: hypothetical protein BWY75_03724 [bacterium ADurb.Bin425]